MREFLKGLELEKDVIDSIMVEYGKHINNVKEQENEYKEEINSLKSTIADLNEKSAGYETKIKELNTTIENNSESLKSLEQVTSENKDLKAQIQMNGSNVKKEFSKFVTSEVMSKVNDDTDFETALNDYKKENPQYFGDVVVKKVQTSPVLGNGEQQPLIISFIIELVV